jgi:hypothetical protein
LKKEADLVTRAKNGRGVLELIEGMLATE